MFKVPFFCYLSCLLSLAIVLLAVQFIYTKTKAVQSISLDELKDFLRSNNFELQPTQTKLCFPIIQRIYRKMAIGVAFENINVCGSLLINGHHRYICSLLLGKFLNSNTWEKPSQITPYKWPELAVDPNDWESIEIIKRHNTKDAVRNAMDIKVFDEPFKKTD